MQYTSVTEGIFRTRPNRFIAEIEINGITEKCHVKNTGRLKELLIPGASVYLEKSSNPSRTTNSALSAVRQSDRIVNIESQIPNALVYEWIRKGNLFPDPEVLKREKTYGKSRFDLYAECGLRKSFLEVKGVTLDCGGTARFPDAPTQRGVKHILELQNCILDGYEAYLLFIIQMKGIHAFSPNDTTHPEFAEALRNAKKAGVHILAFDCSVTKDSISIDSPIPVIL